MRTIQRRLTKLVLLLLLVVPIFPVAAATFESGDAISLKVPMTDDVYAGGGTVNVNESVDGDLVVGGGQVSISGDVTGDVMIGGGSVLLQGAVGDDARIGGGNVTLAGEVTDDVFVGGGSITLTGEAVVGGDLVVGGGAVIIDGVVTGRTIIGAGELILVGTFNGPLKAQADTITIKGVLNAPSQLAAGTAIQLEDGASINADVEYWQPQGVLDFGNVLQGAEASYNPALQINKNKADARQFFARMFAAWFFLSILTAALILGLLMIAFRHSFARAADHLTRSFWKKTGVGVLYFLVTPLIGIILFITIIGWPLGVLTVAAYGLSLLFAKVITALVFAQWISIRYKRNWKPGALYIVSLLIFIVLKLLVFIPIVGWVVILIAVCASFGSFMAMKRDLYRQLEHK